MLYANTIINAGVETVVTILPLSDVPGFNPEYPPQENTYVVDDNVRVGWIKSGGIFIEPSVSHLHVPQSVSRAQFMLGLLQLGLLDQVESLIDASNDRVLQINWRDRLTFDRTNPMVIQMAELLNKSNEDIDALFVLANTL